LGPSGTKTIAESLKGCKSLEIFAIARNRAENEGAIAIADNLKYVEHLRELYIY